MSAVTIILPRRPISSNKNVNPKYSAAIMQAARERQPGILDGPLYARIIWFHKHPTDQDVDNIAKRILDSLKDIVYRDDYAITHCLTARVDARNYYEFADPVLAESDYPSLLQHLNNENARDVLYVEIGQRTSGTVKFGEVL